jgi:hypothetical protein
MVKSKSTRYAINSNLGIVASKEQMKVFIIASVWTQASQTKLQSKKKED